MSTSRLPHRAYAKAILKRLEAIEATIKPRSVRDMEMYVSDEHLLFTVPQRMSRACIDAPVDRVLFVNSDCRNVNGAAHTAILLLATFDQQCGVCVLKPHPRVNKWTANNHCDHTYLLAATL